MIDLRNGTAALSMRTCSKLTMFLLTPLCLLAAPLEMKEETGSLFHFASYLPADFSTPPFWKTKSKILEQIRQERLIAVSVRNRGLNDEDKDFVKNYRAGLNQELACPDLKKCQLMILNGGGYVQAPASTVYKIASNFSEMPKMSSNIHEAKYDEKRSQLFLHTSAYGFHARMLMKVHQDENKEIREIHFMNVTGVVDGMIGVMQFVPVDGRTTEISIRAYYPYQNLKIPAFFLRFGLEIAMKSMASSIRTYVESKYKPRSASHDFVRGKRQYLVASAHR